MFSHYRYCSDRACVCSLCAGEAVHSMMQSWLDAGTSPDLFNSWGWHFEGHPCYKNKSRASDAGRDWDWIYCATRSFQPEDSNLVQYHSLVQLNLWVRNPHLTFDRTPKLTWCIIYWSFPTNWSVRWTIEGVELESLHARLDSRQYQYSLFLREMRERFSCSFSLHSLSFSSVQMVSLW